MPGKITIAHASFLVWRSEVDSDHYRHVRKVHVTLDGAVRIEAFTIGPRGGHNAGYPAFTAAEWEDIAQKVAAQQEEFRERTKG